MVLFLLNKYIRSFFPSGHGHYGSDGRDRQAAAEARSCDFDKSNRIRASLALSAACYICCAPDSCLMWAAVFRSFVIVDFDWFNQMRARC